jgi:hypothetical protein
MREATAARKVIIGKRSTTTKPEICGICGIYEFFARAHLRLRRTACSRRATAGPSGFLTFWRKLKLSHRASFSEVDCQRGPRHHDLCPRQRFSRASATGDDATDPKRSEFGIVSKYLERSPSTTSV